MNISVIIPVYNVEKYISRAIDSVLIQSEVTELILVNDGSTDHSLNICITKQKNDSRIIIAHHPRYRNRGVSASRNLGILIAKNEFVAFLDSDDYYEPGRFNKTKLCFSSNSEIDGVYEMVGIHSDYGIKKKYSIIESIDPNKLFENLQPLGEKVWFHINGLTLKKKIFEKIGYFDESLKTSEDTLQWFKVASVCKLVPGEINNFVALSEKLSTGLSSNKSQVEKDFVVMLLKLFIFCNKFSVSNSRKELVLIKFFYFIFYSSYYKRFWGVNKLKLFLKVIFTDPGYVLFRSQSFRRYVGDIIGYNWLLNVFRVKSCKLNF